MSSASKSELRPNPHPYPIKTTSTALLSRSNSSPHTSQDHHYVPPSPSPSPTRPSPATTRHTYSKSFSISPLPRPPIRDPDPTSTASNTNTNTNTNTTPTRRSKRADTLPSSSPNPTLPAPAPDLEDLPSNPRQWTPAHLASYLATALRVRSSEMMGLALPVDGPMAREITLFVREKGIAGKAFLRYGEDDFEELGVSKQWRTALLDAARTLRQNVLRGHIWALTATPDSNETTTSPRTRSHDKDHNHDHIATITTHFFSNTHNTSSSTSPFALPLPDSPPAKRRHGRTSGYKPGHVKGIVATFERSPAPNARMRTRDGRERTANESGSASASGSSVGENDYSEEDSGSEDVGYTVETLRATSRSSAWKDGLGGIARRFVLPKQEQEQEGVDEDAEQSIETLLARSHSTGGGLNAWEMYLGRETARRVVAPNHPALEPEHADEDEELSIETLLASSTGGGLTAWEMDLGPRETARRIVLPKPASELQPEDADADGEPSETLPSTASVGASAWESSGPRERVVLKREEDVNVGPAMQVLLATSTAGVSAAALENDLRVRETARRVSGVKAHAERVVRDVGRDDRAGLRGSSMSGEGVGDEWDEDGVVGGQVRLMRAMVRFSKRLDQLERRVEEAEEMRREADSADCSRNGNGTGDDRSLLSMLLKPGELLARVVAVARDIPLSAHLPSLALSPYPLQTRTPTPTATPINSSPAHMAQPPAQQDRRQDPAQSHTQTSTQIQGPNHNGHSPPLHDYYGYGYPYLRIPTTMWGLPAYVLCAGLGVCTVVLKVVVGRVVRRVG